MVRHTHLFGLDHRNFSSTILRLAHRLSQYMPNKYIIYLIDIRMIVTHSLKSVIDMLYVINFILMKGHKIYCNYVIEV